MHVLARAGYPIYGWYTETTTAVTSAATVKRRRRKKNTKTMMSCPLSAQRTIHIVFLFRRFSLFALTFGPFLSFCWWYRYYLSEQIDLWPIHLLWCFAVVFNAHSLCVCVHCVSLYFPWSIFIFPSHSFHRAIFGLSAYLATHTRQHNGTRARSSPFFAIEENRMENWNGFILLHSWAHGRPYNITITTLINWWCLWYLRTSHTHTQANNNK